MKQLFALVLSVACCVYEPACAGTCDRDTYKQVSYLAEIGGYSWPHSRETCDMTEEVIGGRKTWFIWSNSPSGSAWQVIWRLQPEEVVFTRGGSIRFLCLRVMNRQYQQVDCQSM